MSEPSRPIDVCLLLEGTYPYVAGGVSSWVHDIIATHKHLNFHVAALLADQTPPEMRYKPPPNMVGISHVFLQKLPIGDKPNGRNERLPLQLQPALTRLLSRGGLTDVAEILRLIAPFRGDLGRRVLLDSPAAWEVIGRMYQDAMGQTSFLDYFWTWRALVGGLIAVMLAEVPHARCYHAVSTGYAGLLAARMVLETGRPGILTEHGIYTNERRIEIAMADWLHQSDAGGLAVEKPKRDLRDLWIDTFVSYARATYDACGDIITLYSGNQDLQRREGADPAKLRVIPNGIDYARFAKVARDDGDRRPTVALIGRVVPIKDVKTFIRAIALLRQTVPDVLADILGPTDEDQTYFEECQSMVDHLALGDHVRFLGRVALDQHLGRVDAIALTSISEAQPLVILEAGAAGVPCVATDVGACSEMIHGMPDEEPALGSGGAIVPVSNPTRTAAALHRLLTDGVWWQDCSTAIRARVERYYNKVHLDRIYADLYAERIAAADRPPAVGRAA